MYPSFSPFPLSRSLIDSLLSLTPPGSLYLTSDEGSEGPRHEKEALLACHRLGY